jgi:hypothetical protein
MYAKVEKTHIWCPISHHFVQQNFPHDLFYITLYRAVKILVPYRCYVMLYNYFYMPYYTSPLKDALSKLMILTGGEAYLPLR